MLVFVNDATGYVGRVLVEKLLAAEHEVIGTIAEGGSGSTKGLKESCPISDVNASNALVMKAELIRFSKSLGKSRT